MWGVRVCVVVGLSLPHTGCVGVPGFSRGRSLEQSVIFQPQPFTDKDSRPGDVDFEDARFQASDGVRLHGWFAPSARPGPVVLYCHGNAGNVTHRRWVLRLFRDRLHASILVFDYRGYGKSEGSPSEAGILADARAARRWLAGRTGVNETDIVLVGNSLGGGVAVDLASDDGARGLILENTFTSLPDVAASHSTVFPLHRLLSMRLDSAAKIRRYKGPLLQTHGTADRVVPFELGQRLFEAANEPKTFVSVPDGGHNDAPSAEYLAALKEFLRAN